MQLFKRFRQPEKEGSITYSSVNDDADSLDTDANNSFSGRPSAPKPVSTSITWIVIDCFLLGLPVAFITLAALACQLDGKELSGLGKRVQNAMLLGPTIYPLVFAALGGRTLRKIALWSASEGTTLGLLEHLLGSQSLVATMGHAITLRTLDVLTLALLAFWALSPLGGQSALRLLHETNSTITETRTAYYSKVDADVQLLGLHDDDMCNLGNAVVAAALMTAAKLEKAPDDVWSHPKIPRIKDLERSASQNSTERPWYTVDSNSTDSYASLAGINVMNLSERGSTNITVEYEYMYFSCELSPHNNYTYNGTTFATPWPYPLSVEQYILDLYNQSILTTQGWPPFEGYKKFEDNSFFMYTKGSKHGKVDTLLYGSKHINSIEYVLWECPVNTVMVEAEIVCQIDKCAVDRIRRAARANTLDTRRFTAYGTIAYQDWTRRYVQALASLGGKVSFVRANPVDAYIFNQTQWAVETDVAYTIVESKDWTPYVGKPQKAVELSHRLTMVINAYFDAFCWPRAIAMSDPFAKKSFNATTGQPLPGMALQATDAIVSIPISIYRVNAPWAGILIVCSATLSLLGIFGIFVQLRTTAPDILNNVSSFTRENPYIDGAPGGSALDGADRARLLKKMRVQLGDVDAKAKTGYIAFRSVESQEDCESGRVRKGRLYH